MNEARIKKAEKRLKNRLYRNEPLPKLVFWDSKPTAEELAALEARGLKPMIVEWG